MFTRIVELTPKPGKNEQLSATINDKILSILKKQKGFVDEMVLVSDKEDNRVLGLSFWNTREDAEQYHRTEYPKVQETLRPLLEAEAGPQLLHVHGPQNCSRQSCLAGAPRLAIVRDVGALLVHHSPPYVLSSIIIPQRPIDPCLLPRLLPLEPGQHIRDRLFSSRSPQPCRLPSPCNRFRLFHLNLIVSTYTYL